MKHQLGLKNKLVIISAVIGLLTACNKKQDLDALFENKTTKSSAMAQATGLIPGGLIDNTLMLQSFLDENNRNILNIEGTYLTSQLTVHSYDTIIMGSDFKLQLNPLVTMQPILYFPAGTHDVYIKGGVLDANWQNNVFGSQLECI